MKIRNLFIAASVTLAALISSTVGVSGAANAQGAAAGTGQSSAGAVRGQKRESPLTAGLTAAVPTAAQQKQIKAIEKKYREERKAEMPQPAAGDTTARPKLTPELRTKLQEEADREAAEVKAILTPDQQTKFQAAYDAAKAKRGNGGQLAAFAEKLNLTDDQKTKITPIMTDAAQQMMKLRGDSTLDRQSKMQQMMTIWNGAKEKIRPLLTPDQQKTLDEMRSMRGGRGGRRGGLGAGGAGATSN